MKSDYLKRWMPVILWAVFIIILSSNSDPYGLLPETWFQWIYLTHIYGIRLTKIIGPLGHMIQFAILAFLLGRALVWKGDLEGKHLILAFSLSLLFAISDEIHQHFVPLRAFQLADIIIDGLGVLLGLAVYIFRFSYRYYLLHRKESHSSRYYHG